MTERIDRFFDGVDAFQRKVQYFEPMEWEERTVGDSVTRERRPLVLTEELLWRSRG
ncbi:MAG: hypothetical protein KC621_12200 [Myxococcales bacterium]|nr:hypothetical protein [Myxococcales bacterium]